MTINCSHCNFSSLIGVGKYAVTLSPELKVGLFDRLVGVVAVVNIFDWRVLSAGDLSLFVFDG